MASMDSQPKTSVLSWCPTPQRSAPSPLQEQQTRPRLSPEPLINSRHGIRQTASYRGVSWCLLASEQMLGSNPRSWWGDI